LAGDAPNFSGGWKSSPLAGQTFSGAWKPWRRTGKVLQPPEKLLKSGGKLLGGKGDFSADRKSPAG
jgi:hypothetical protein